MRNGALYLAIGDSTTYNVVTNGASLYSSVAQQNIAQNYGQLRTINLGISGSTSADIVRDLQIAGGTLEPDILTIGLGINDSAGGAVSVSNFETNLQTIINHFRRQNPNVVIVLCTANTVESQATYTTETLLAPYRTAMDTVASGYSSSVYVCHFENAWTQANASTYIYNGQNFVHPNDTGHQALGALLYPVIQQHASNILSTLS